MDPTKSQIWARNLSKGLESSYESSALIAHKVTSGGNRENQILDILKYLLPRKYSIEKNVVIINSANEETIKFDGALIDDDNWPKLFADNDLIVSPIESVKIAFEIKSNLGLTEITKIYKEAQNINISSPLSNDLSPKVVGFAYRCANIKLTYYDFVDAFIRNDHYPVMIAILNVGILCFMDKEKNITKIPDNSCSPILLETAEDTLLVFTYLLTAHISEDQVAVTIRRYSKQFFTTMSFFEFDRLFIEKMKVTPDEFRKPFEGKLATNIKDTYEALKEDLGI